jgi:hypothetical protein
MCVLIGNMVKTETADYPCHSREEAEALYFALKSGRKTEPQLKEERARREQPEPATAD